MIEIKVNVNKKVVGGCLLQSVFIGKGAINYDMLNGNLKGIIKEDCQNYASAADGYSQSASASANAASLSRDRAAASEADAETAAIKAEKEAANAQNSATTSREWALKSQQWAQGVPTHYYVNSTAEMEKISDMKRGDLCFVMPAIYGKNMVYLNDVSETEVNGVTYSVKDGILYITGQTTSEADIVLTMSYSPAFKEIYDSVVLSCHCLNGYYREQDTSSKPLPVNGSTGNEYYGIKTFIVPESPGSPLYADPVFICIADIPTASSVLTEITLQIPQNMKFEEYQMALQCKFGTEVTEYTPYTVPVDDTPSQQYVYDTNDIDGDGENPEWIFMGYFSPRPSIMWDMISDKPEFNEVAYTGDYLYLKNKPNRYESFQTITDGIWTYPSTDKIILTETNLVHLGGVTNGSIGMIKTEFDINLPENSYKSADYDYLSLSSGQHWLYTFIYDGSHFHWNRTVCG